MATPQSTITGVPILSGGQWQKPGVEKYWDVYNPSTGEIIARTPMCGEKEVNAAVQSALTAFSKWSQTPVSTRANILFKYRNILESHLEEIAKLITLENGKTLEEARGDVRRGFEMVEFACGIIHLTKGENISQLAENIDGQTIREPLGVCAGITPFNFPAMIPLWMFPIAIACGNTFILKPSEKVPLTANRLAELFQEAGLPEGVMNIVHGGQDVVNALCTHPQISAISFVGSSKIAQYVYGLGCQNGKRVQCGGGAKNVLIVMPDAEPTTTIRAIMGSAFGCSGQRCMAGSILIGLDKHGDELKDRVVTTMSALKIGNTYADEKAEMGPVIDQASKDRVLSYIDKGTTEGAKLAHDGRKTSLPEHGFFVGPTLFDHVNPKMSIAQDEIFGPVLSLIRASSVDEAIALANQSPYGNGATIFTSSGSVARQFLREIKCGMVGINVGIPAPMAIFPFSGWNRSFFGDLHMQGTESISFYTRQKVILSRWDKDYQRKLGW